MSDAINFPLSDSNQDSNFPADMLSASRPQETGDDLGKATPPAAEAPEHPAADSFSSAAAEAARALSADSRPEARDHASTPVERRRRRRARISAPVRVRSLDITEAGPDEVSTTVDISPNGLLFIATNPYFQVEMDVAVTFPYCKSPGAMHAEQQGCVTRVHEMPDGRFMVAVAIGAGVGEDLVDACGRKLATDPVRVSYGAELGTKKPLVLAVDADDAVRDTMKTFLSSEGYDVIAVSTGAEAREILKKFTPSLLIAEVEGEDLPGFDLCAHVKSDNRLKHIHVLLTTRSGNPTDYSNAHSLGAVVCMAKPYKQDRLGHVVRLLVPPPHLCAQSMPAPHPADPSRRTFNGNAGKSCSSTPGNGSRRFRFPSFLS
jgi:CheY-like chemotaxis protein